LSEDKELASSFEIFEELNQHLSNKFGNSADLSAFTQNLNSIAATHFKPKKAKVISLRSWKYSVAASVAILIGLFVFMQNNNPNFEDYNQHENAYFTERGNEDTQLKLAQDAFNAKKYKEAVANFELILKEKKSPEMQLFYSISLLEDNQFQKAEIQLMDLKLGNSIFKNKAIWYLALSKLKQKEYKSCKEILLTIPDDFEDYDQVQQLLNELD
ncbi:tetratricopeptide repeat protein, partial [Flavobacterium sp.]|uniref:tetratricopeptide repeat protein n=1 Tax=Flavobacterium sp. TaxID=239 RepID=UPI0038FC6734